jgi:hypothetical protein
MVEGAIVIPLPFRLSSLLCVVSLAL